MVRTMTSRFAAVALIAAVLVLGIFPTIALADDEQPQSSGLLGGLLGPVVEIVDGVVDAVPVQVIDLAPDPQPEPDPVEPPPVPVREEEDATVATRGPAVSDPARPEQRAPRLTQQPQPDVSFPTFEPVEYGGRVPVTASRARTTVPARAPVALAYVVVAMGIALLAPYARANVRRLTA